MQHVIAISGGKDSTALALALAEREPRAYEFLITPTGNELPEMAAHWGNLERLLGKPLVRLRAFDTPDGLRHLIEQFNALPNHRQRWCTRMLKIEPTIHWLMLNAPCVQYVGLRADEEERTGIYGEIPGVQQRYPLREWGWDESDVWDYLASRGVRIPKRTDCAWCYGQRLGEWWRLLRDYPELYAQAESLEDATGRTFRSASRDTWPAGLRALRAAFTERLPKGEARERLPLEMYESSEDAQPCRVCRM